MPKSKHPNLAYLHLVEPHITGDSDVETQEESKHESNDFVRAIWEPRPLATAGGYSRESAMKAAEEKGELIAFGRLSISNPDLPTRWKENIPLTPYNSQTFYTRGDQEGAEVDYIDYPFANVN